VAIYGLLSAVAASPQLRGTRSPEQQVSCRVMHAQSLSTGLKKVLKLDFRGHENALLIEH